MRLRRILHINYAVPLDQLPDPLPIVPLERPFDVTITPPGSKSITNRAYVLAALADGESRIVRPLRALDTDLLLDALCTLGAEARWEGDDVVINGVNGRFPRGGAVNLGDGGTPTRFMIAAACLATEPVVVDGSARMRERPVAEGVAMLRKLGAKIEYVEAEERLPVRVLPGGLRGGEIEIGRTASSQFISAIMLVAPFLSEPTVLRHREAITSESYVDLTLGTLAEWKVDYDVVRRPLPHSAILAHSIRPSVIQGIEYRIAPDASSDIYWLVAAALMPTARLHLRDNTFGDQPDGLCINALEDAGVEHSDCYADFFVDGPAQLNPFRFDAAGAPDGALALAALASRCEGKCWLTGLRTLRVKETDRIAALANELRKVGCTVETGDEWISIDPPHGLETRATTPVTIETYNDHRMAMAFAVLGLVRPGISIRHPACVAKSYPGFWRDFQKLYDNPRH